MMTQSTKRSLTVGLVAVALAATSAAGCGTSEESGKIGDTLTAKGLKATVLKLDDSVPVPSNDITGLASPSPGSRLVGALASVCSNHGGAIGPFDFGIETTKGKPGRLKFPQHNYARGFDIVRNGCGSGWVVFEIPRGAKPGAVTFGFEDTGTSQHPETQVDASFTWSVRG